MTRKRFNIKTTWIWTYFIVIIVMSIVFLGGLGLIQRKIEDDAKNRTYDNAVYMKNSLDDVWSRVYLSSLQIINDKTAAFLDKNPSYTGWTVEGYRVSQDIKNYLLSNDIVEDVYLYYPKNDYVIGKNGVYESHTYWASEYLHDNSYEYETWLNDLFGNRTTGYSSIDHGGEVSLYYRLSSPTITGRILVARINRQNLEDTLAWIRTDNDQSFLAMASSTDVVYAYSGNYEKYVKPDSNVLLYEQINNTIHTVIDSDVTDMKYIMVTEMTEAMKTQESVVRVAIICMLLSIAAGIIVLIIIVNRNAKPIEKIAEKLASGETLTGNELQIIDEKIDGLIEENQLNIEKYRHHQEMLVRRSFLNDCIRFGQPVQRDIEIIASFYTLTFDYNKFAVVIRERSGDDNSNNIQDYLERYVESDGRVAWTQQQDLDIFMINYDQDERLSVNGEELSTFEAFVHDITKLLSSEQSRVVSCDPFNNIEGLRRGYLDCLKRLGRKEIALTTAREDRGEDFNVLEYRSSLGLFQNYIIDEDYINAKKILPEIIADDQVKKFDSSYKYYLLTWININGKAPRSEIDKIKEANSYGELNNAIAEALDHMISNRSDEQLSNDESDIAGRARIIIDESYENPLLGLCMIAENLGLSQSYVSRIYKKKYGIGIAQYVNQVRVMHARELLSTESLSIKEIALMTGFSSDVILIRVFKKLEGITPGAYRDNMKYG